MNQQLYKYVYSQPKSVIASRKMQNIKNPFTGGEVEFALLAAVCATGDVMYICADLTLGVTAPSFTSDTMAGEYEGYVIPGGFSFSLVPIFSYFKDSVGVIASGSAGDVSSCILVFRQRLCIKSYVPQDTSMTGDTSDHFSKSGQQQGGTTIIRKLGPLRGVKSHGS